MFTGPVCGDGVSPPGNIFLKGVSRICEGNSAAPVRVEGALGSEDNPGGNWPTVQDGFGISGPVP